MRELILDMDSSVSETYGEQEGTAYNGHSGCTCYHPLFCFNQFGDVEQSLLRDGNVHSAKDWRAVLAPVVARYQGRNPRRNQAFGSTAKGGKVSVFLTVSSLERPFGRMSLICNMLEMSRLDSLGS
jgi:hypothetical protein